MQVFITNIFKSHTSLILYIIQLKHRFKEWLNSILIILTWFRPSFFQIFVNPKNLKQGCPDLGKIINNTYNRDTWYVSQSKNIRESIHISHN